jgi:hypothetical protein
MDLNFYVNDNEINKFAKINACSNSKKNCSNLVLYFDHTTHLISNIVFSTKMFRSFYLMLQPGENIIIIEAKIDLSLSEKKEYKRHTFLITS